MNFFKKLFSWGKKSTQEKDKIEKALEKIRKMLK